MVGAPEAHHEKTGYGLRRGALSPVETLAQSVSTISPTATPVATIPLVCALAGNGTWLAYILATAAIFLVALCVSKFARYSASPGSLYSYAAPILPPAVGAIVAWSLLLAYIATGSSVIGGFYHYGNLLILDAGDHAVSAVILSVMVTGISVWIAWRDVKVSARLMLWIEAVSVSLILIVVVLVLVRFRHHLDWQQLQLRGMTGSGLRLGLVLAMFSFVGFESATTLGSEARDPLKTIPRAVIQSALLSGAIFTVCAYAEVLGFRAAGQDLGTSPAPMRVLAAVGGVGFLGLVDRYWRAGEPVCMHARVHHRRGACAPADVARRIDARLASRDARAQRNAGPRRDRDRNCRRPSGGRARRARRERTGCIRLDGFARNVRLHRGLRTDLPCAAALPAQSWRFSSRGADHSLAHVLRHAARAGRKSLSRSGRAPTANCH